MEAVYRELSPEYVVNFAAESHNDRAIIDSSAFMRSNALGAQVLLECSRRHPVRAHLHVSTIEVYGELPPGRRYFDESSPLNAKTPSVRVARSDDEEALAAIDSVAWTPASGFPSVIARAGGSFFSAGHPAAACLVAEADGAVAGYVVVQPATPLPGNAHVHGIAGLAVAPGARGRGVASALLAAAGRHARERGARKLSLRVLSTNEAALRLHERLGFRREATLREEPLVNGRYVDDVLMARLLGGSPGHA
jgi:ribosomal protein S18 acetylase RimI-like enzyme